MRKINWLYVALGLALVASLRQWRGEYKRRVAVEAQYGYDFDGDLRIGHVPPRVTQALYPDSIWAIEPKYEKPDSAWYFRWKDSTWRYASIPRHVLIGIVPSRFNQWD